jgi:hypothetical protein
MKKSDGIWILLIYMFSCTSPANIDFGNIETHPVANCMLTPDSTFTVYLSSSLRADRDDKFNPIDNALVTISGNSATCTLMNNGGGCYSARQFPDPGREYLLEITGKDGNKLEATTKVPQEFYVEVIPRWKEHMVQVIIRDNPLEKNFYWVCLRKYNPLHNKMEYEYYLSSNYLLFDDFNRIKKDDWDPLNNLQYSFHFYTRLEDVAFNGRTAEFDLFYHWPDSVFNEYLKPIPWKIWLTVFNVDPHLDKYMKSALVQFELNGAGDNPVFATPISIYSNMLNGKGIFGSYTVIQHDLNKLNP